MKCKMVGSFDNANCRSNGMATIKFRFPNSELANYSKSLLMVGMKGKGQVETEDGEKISLGMVAFRGLSIYIPSI
jgi:hypothetical protein